MKLSHIDSSGRAKMVDVSKKGVSDRKAVAEGVITMSAEAAQLIAENRGPKGDVLITAELAGTMAAKRTAELIPLCHQLQLGHTDVVAELDPELPGVRVTTTVQVSARTGAEMEALTATSVALLTVYDMVKATGHAMQIGGIRLLKKSGGASGDWNAET